MLIKGKYMFKDLTQEERSTLLLKARQDKQRELDAWLEELADSGSKRGKSIHKAIKYVPDRYKHKYMLALEGRLSRGEASKLHCIECSGWSRSEAVLCPDKICTMSGHKLTSSKK